MDSPDRHAATPPTPPATTLSRRVAPTVKLRRVCCSRCSKVPDQAGPPTYDATATKKCSRCSQLHKECKLFPLKFNAQFNLLVCIAKRLNANKDNKSPTVAAFTTAQRKFFKELNAFVCKGVKHKSTRKPKGNKLVLLLVKSVNRLAASIKGVLDLLRHSKGLPPLSADNAQTDPGSNNSSLSSRLQSISPTLRASKRAADKAATSLLSKKRCCAVKLILLRLRRAALRKANKSKAVKSKDNAIIVSSEASDEDEDDNDDDGPA